MARHSLLLLLAVGLAVLSCAPAKPQPKGPTRPLSAWTGEEADLFDDGVDNGALPVVADTPPQRDETNEAKIPKRVDQADGVVQAKVLGVSSEPMGDRKRYRLELVTESLLSGTALESPFHLTVEPDAPAYGTVRALDAQLIGRRLVVFYKGYAADDGGDPVTHFHLSAPTPSVLEGIKLHKVRKQFD